MKLVLIAVLVCLSMALPKEFSWNNVNAITPVGNQGSCDSAIGWVTATMYEVEYYRQTGNLLSSSVQYLLSCSQRMSCNAGFTNIEHFQAMLEYVKTTSMAYDSQFPYTSDTVTSGTPGLATGCNSGRRFAVSRPIKLSKKKAVSSSTLKGWIARAPVGAMVNKETAFTNHKGTGVLTCSTNKPADSALNHAVVVIGYTADTNWVIQNSMGQTWGANGIGTLKKDKECGLRRRVYRYNWSFKAAVATFLLIISFMAI